MTRHLPVVRLLWLSVVVVALLGLPAMGVAKNVDTHPAFQGVSGQAGWSAGPSNSEKAEKTCCTVCIPGTTVVSDVPSDPDDLISRLDLPQPETRTGTEPEPLRKPPRRIV